MTTNQWLVIKFPIVRRYKAAEILCHMGLPQWMKEKWGNGGLSLGMGIQMLSMKKWVTGIWTHDRIEACECISGIKPLCYNYNLSREFPEVWKTILSIIVTHNLGYCKCSATMVPKNVDKWSQRQMHMFFRSAFIE